ncbi:hypothetical protein BBK36DRAFT_1141869 [Trichoderma citrinoviride]|uniref:Uncharacterized protein n=1 Tax=Trichoderma citrinoviride TaxID=58853 RepID=A0A2T4B9H7_9HYPO|nr:hypothetical protein BBK36DRAFT_1141869 [Trichoderma citrinoviride]PTB65948.1 hypothetical protein BBK36DRAFT_1141869 [Trichoderma citrinoviride]
MPRWNRLPEELKLQVLDFLAQDPYSGSRHGSLTNYALVCKSWQRIFEETNFQRLVLHQNDLDGVARLPKRCRPYVAHVCLRIELSEYVPWAGEQFATIRPAIVRPERMEDIAANNEIIELAVGKLFSALKTWERWAKPDHRITLEMSFHSPSDSKYVGRGIHAKELDRGLPSMTGISRAGAGDRIFGGYVHIQFHQQLPRLHMVERFIMQRHTRRQPTSFTMHQLLSRFPNLEDLVFEPWQQYLDTSQDRVDAGYVRLVKGSLPKGLKHFTFFEDHDEKRTKSSLAQGVPARVPNPHVSAALAQKSLGLETFSASFLVDARDFFRAYRREWTWANLRSLTLTSQYLEITRGSYEINGMLKGAAEAALAMPVLETLEIWNGGPGHAAVFRYSGGKGGATLEWIGTWDLFIDSGVVEAWETVALKSHGWQMLGLEKHLIQNPHDIRRHGDAIKLLKTKERVIRPQSLEELQFEAKEGGLCFP